MELFVALLSFQLCRGYVAMSESLHRMVKRDLRIFAVSTRRQIDGNEN
jgi:hypothetical protein